MAEYDATPSHCYILHRRAFRESSLIVDVLTQDKGFVAVVLKGAAKAKGKSIAANALAQPFRPLLMTLRGQGEMKNAFAWEDNGAPFSLQDKYLYSGFYINELICRLWPKHIEADELYALYVQSLKALASVQDKAPVDNTQLERILRRFELTLLNLLGFAVDCHYTADTGEPIAAQDFYLFDPSLGFTKALANFDNPNVTRQFSGADIVAIGELDFSSNTVLKAAKRLTRIALALHLGDRPLKSRELFTAIR